ncbi:hypothetical protein EYF80_048289 [Liparis tanakae]|uniref:Uncharacterized protein n=1 Tax=Liparis tanakae TaxID=230148 RepID=A0A4Z2FK86_9TELE|nr:hypothetical protein EYF80_048289 [Liparis tanakae]
MERMGKEDRKKRRREDGNKPSHAVVSTRTLSDLALTFATRLLYCTWTLDQQQEVEAADHRGSF